MILRGTAPGERQPRGAQTLLATISRTQRGIFAEIGAALTPDDLPAARRLAHALKGVAGTVALVELQATASALEKSADHDRQRVGAPGEL